MSETKEQYLVRINGTLARLSSATRSSTTIDQLTRATNEILIEIVKSVAEIRINLFPDPKVNPDTVLCYTVVVSTAGTAERLPDVDIPYDCSVVVLALSANTGTAYVASSKPNAESSTTRFPLEPGESVKYKIQNLSKLWLNVSVSGEGVVCTVEQDAKEKNAKEKN